MTTEPNTTPPSGEMDRRLREALVDREIRVDELEYQVENFKESQATHLRRIKELEGALERAQAAGVKATNMMSTRVKDRDQTIEDLRGMIRTNEENAHALEAEIDHQNLTIERLEAEVAEKELEAERNLDSSKLWASAAKDRDELIDDYKRQMLDGARREIGCGKKVAELEALLDQERAWRKIADAEAVSVGERSSKDSEDWQTLTEGLREQLKAARFKAHDLEERLQEVKDRAGADAELAARADADRVEHIKMLQVDNTDREHWMDVASEYQGMASLVLGRNPEEDPPTAGELRAHIDSLNRDQDRAADLGIGTLANAHCSALQSLAAAALHSGTIENHGSDWKDGRLVRVMRVYHTDALEPFWPKESDRPFVDLIIEADGSMGIL